MKKIIVKCKLKNREEFEKKLSDIEMTFGPVVWQHDRVYVPRNYQSRSNYPRIIMRTEMKAVDKPAKYEMILKRHIEDSGVDIVDSTVVKDYVEAVNMVQQLGFEQKKEVSRKRQELVMGEGAVMYLDKVEDAPGFYAKIETVIADNGIVSEAVNDLTKTFAVLGEKNVVKTPYFEM